MRKEKRNKKKRIRLNEKLIYFFLIIRIIYFNMKANIHNDKKIFNAILFCKKIQDLNDIGIIYFVIS
jgi:hypothetical protein